MLQPLLPTQPLTATLEVQEWNLIFQGLAELQKAAASVIGKLNQQLVPPELVPAQHSAVPADNNAP